MTYIKSPPAELNSTNLCTRHSSVNELQKKNHFKRRVKTNMFLFKEQSMLKLVEHDESLLYANNENSQCVQIYIGRK